MIQTPQTIPLPAPILLFLSERSGKIENPFLPLPTGGPPPLFFPPASAQESAVARGGGRERPKVYRGVESVNALRKCRFLFSTRLKRCGPSPRCSSPWPPRQSCWCPRRPWQAARSTTTTTTTTTRSTRDSNTSSPGNGKGGIRQEVIFPLYLFFWQEPVYCFCIV